MDQKLLVIGEALDAGNDVRWQMGAMPSEAERRPNKALLLFGLFGVASYSANRKVPTREQVRKLANLLDDFYRLLDGAALLIEDPELLSCVQGMSGAGSALWDEGVSVDRLQPLVLPATGRLLDIQTRLFLGR